jgi:hypothetical protein
MDFEHLFAHSKIWSHWQVGEWFIHVTLLLHVFIGEMLANMTQVSDMAPGPLVNI